MECQSAKYQYVAVSVVLMMSIGYGVIVGWASPSVNLLTTDETPLPSGKITMEEASWITSLLAVGSLFGSIFVGILMNKYGRKFTMILLAIPMIISWMLVLFAENVYYLYAARVFHGIIVGGALVVVPVYLREIACDRIRGTLISFMMFSGNVGMEIEFILGAFCSFYTAPVFVIALTVLFVVSFSFFPETPMYLVKQNRISEAEKSIRFYQDIHEKDSHLLQLELEKLEHVIGKSATKISTETSLKWKDLTTRPGSRAMMIGTVLSALVHFSGSFVLISYAANIFKDSGAALSPNICAIIIGVLQFCGSASLTFLVDRAGRRFLYIASTIGAALGYITVGVYTTFKSLGYEIEALNWIPIVGLSFVIYIMSWAISPLPFTIIAEIMPERLKEFGMTYCNILMSVCAFISIKYFPLLTDLLGLHGCMFLFAGVCSACAVYIIIYLPETKGKSYDEIMESLE